MVNITVRVLSRPRQEELSTIYKELGTDFDERVLPSIVNEVLKAAEQAVAARGPHFVFKVLRSKL